MQLTGRHGDLAIDTGSLEMENFALPAGFQAELLAQLGGEVFDRLACLGWRKGMEW